MALRTQFLVCVGRSQKGANSIRQILRCWICIFCDKSVFSSFMVGSIGLFYADDVVQKVLDVSVHRNNILKKGDRGKNTRQS